MEAQQLLDSFFPELTLEQKEKILWQLTGFPHFWPRRNNETTEERLRVELTKVRRLLDSGETLGQMLSYDSPKVLRAVRNS